MQHHAKSSKNHAKIVQNELFLPVRTYMYTLQQKAFFQRKTVRKRLFFPIIRAGMAGEDARPTKKNWPRLKRMASWARQQKQITEAADGGARARTGADGAVVLNLRRGPGAYALLLRADGQLTRAGQHCCSHLALGLPARTSTTTSPLSERVQRSSAQRAEEACAP